MIISLINIIFSTIMFGYELEFSNDYNEVMKEAQKEKKDVYMLITSSNCRWCKKFEESTLINIPLIKTIEKKYVILHVTRGFDDIPQKFEALRVPKHYFLSNKGEIIYSFAGYWSAEDFSSFLDDVAKRKKEFRI